MPSYFPANSEKAIPVAKAGWDLGFASASEYKLVRQYSGITMFDIHPSAIENYNKKAEALATLVEESDQKRSKKTPYPSDIHISSEIGEKEIIVDIEENTTNYKGRVIERFFRHNKIRYSISEESYKQLIELAERVQRSHQVREKLSVSFVEDKLFTWVKSLYINGKFESSFIQYLHSEAEKVIQPITVFVPLANVVVQTPFSFCGIVVRTITKSMTDQLFGQMLTPKTDEERQAHNELVNNFRYDYQGYGAVVVNLRCEPTFAQEVALEKASRVCDLLGIYFGYVYISDIKCPVQVKGMEGLSTSTTISLSEGRLISIAKKITDPASMQTIGIDNAKLIDMKKGGLDIVSKLETKKDKSEFEKCVLNMAYLYAKSAFTSDPMEKLVYILSALESTLLKNNNEPIQQNLAERMAIVTSSELVKRKEIVKNVKFVYGLRSRYLHHGQTSTELSQLSSFLLDVWLFYLRLLSSIGQHTSKEEFLDAIDDKKLA